MWEDLPSTRAEMTLPSADRLRLILVASFSRSPCRQERVSPSQDVSRRGSNGQRRVLVGQNTHRYNIAETYSPMQQNQKITDTLFYNKAMGEMKPEHTDFVLEMNMKNYYTTTRISSTSPTLV